MVEGNDFDPDGDGMHNEYEVKNGLNPLVHDAFLDSDHDGSSNLAESLFGTRANDSSSRTYLSVELVASDVIQVRWPSAPGPIYHLDEGPALQRWDEALTVTATQGETLAQLPLAPGSRYFRVTATQP